MNYWIDIINAENHAYNLFLDKKTHLIQNLESNMFIILIAGSHSRLKEDYQGLIEVHTLNLMVS